MTMYNAKHSGDQYQISKFNSQGEVESSYLCSHHECQCPAGVRPSCRHRQMLPTFLEQGLVNSNLFLDWDNGRRIVDFKGQPATVQSNEIIEPDLASQAHTDTIDRPHLTAQEPLVTIEGEMKNQFVAVDSKPSSAIAPPATLWRRF